MNTKLNKKPNVVVIGGGTGSYVVLSGLRDKDVNVTSLVTMMDSGGSTGRLRDQLGVLPPGDLRQSLVALSSSSKIWRDLFLYRFDSGDFDGHNFGNIFISALEKITGSIEDGLALASEVLQVNGDVLPITLDNSQLCVTLKDGSVIEGESYIDMEYLDRPFITHSFLKPVAKANTKAIKAIELADYIILGPGDLFTSLIPNLLVKGIPEAFSKSKAKVIYISNLMTKTGQTEGFSVLNHLDELLKYSGKDMFEYILVNNSLPSGQAIKWYRSVRSTLVLDDTSKRDVKSTKIIRGNFISDITYKSRSGDKTKRSLLRHDSEKLAKALLKIFES